MKLNINPLWRVVIIRWICSAGSLTACCVFSPGFGRHANQMYWIQIRPLRIPNVPCLVPYHGISRSISCTLARKQIGCRTHHAMARNFLLWESGMISWCVTVWQIQSVKKLNEQNWWFLTTNKLWPLQTFGEINRFLIEMQSESLSKIHYGCPPSNLFLASTRMFLSLSQSWVILLPFLLSSWM